MIELENNQRALYQWMLNKRVIVDGFPAGTLVEFSHKYDCKDSAVPMYAYEEGGHVYADIPNSLLQKCGYLKVNVSPSANDVYHVPHTKDIKIVRREKPEDYVYSETEVPSYASLDKRLGYLERNSVSEEQIEAAIAAYLEKNPIDPGGNSGDASRVANVDLPASNWRGDTSPYSQIVEIEGVTEYSQVDLTPSIEQLAIFHNKDLAFVTENEDGVVTVYALGDKPENDYTMQVTIKEVSV